MNTICFVYTDCVLALIQNEDALVSIFICDKPSYTGAQSLTFSVCIYVANEFKTVTKFPSKLVFS